MQISTLICAILRKKQFTLIKLTQINIMKQYFFLSLATALLIGCASSKTTSENKLMENEKNEGWKLLFDGETLNGWRTYQNKASDLWTVSDGILHCKGNTTNKTDMQVDLITNEQFENFDLNIDWKIEQPIISEKDQQLPTLTELMRKSLISRS